MIGLSEMEQKILAEFEDGALPKVVAARLKVGRGTVENYKTRMRKKCYDAGNFLKEMQKHSKVLGLRIMVRVESRPKRKV